jgi:hypothetical protein
VKSVATPEFWRYHNRLPAEVQRQAREAFERWKENPNHPGVRFKKVGLSEPLYSARIGEHYRAVAYVAEGTAVWFFIGSHAEYDKLLN